MASSHSLSQCEFLQGCLYFSPGRTSGLLTLCSSIGQLDSETAEGAGCVEGRLFIYVFLLLVLGID